MTGLKTQIRTVHASALLIGRRGLLIRGPSGSGKSTLCLELLRLAEATGRYACLVADDRCALEVVNGRLIATVPQSIAGLIEVRGLGLLRLPYRPSGMIDGIAELVGGEPPPRLPDSQDTEVELAGLRLPLLKLAAADNANRDRLMAWLDAGESLLHGTRLMGEAE